jgi:hypothetical protein
MAPPPTFKNYDPANCLIVWNKIPIQGFAPGTFVRVARNEDTWTLTVGAGGDQVRTRNRNKSGKITITLLQSSPTNDLLSAAAKNDEKNGTGFGEFLLRELTSTTIVQGANAWVDKPADIEFGADASNREWTLTVGDLDTFVGGEVI